jgi:hypothetical protein
MSRLFLSQNIEDGNARAGLCRLLAREELGGWQRGVVLAQQLTRRRRQRAASEREGDGPELCGGVDDACLQRSEAGLELGRCLAEHAALSALEVPAPRHKYPDQTPDLTEICLHLFESGHAFNYDVGQVHLPPVGAARFARVLDGLEDGASVAVVTLLGSLNPVTTGHVRCCVEARQMLVGPAQTKSARIVGPSGPFDCCIGLLQLNSDQRVSHKMAVAPAGDDASIPYAERQRLVQISTASTEWLGCGWPQDFEDICARWPRLVMTRFEISGADDVVKYGKFWSQPDARMIVMGRSCSTAALREGMARARDSLGRLSPICDDDQNFVVGPELPDISSSAARQAAISGDREAMSGLVHPAVAEWLLRQAWAMECGDEKSLQRTTSSSAVAEIRQRLSSASGGDPFVTEDDVTACATEVSTMRKLWLVPAPAPCSLEEGEPPLKASGAPARPPPPPPPPPPAPAPSASVEQSSSRLLRVDGRTRLFLEIERKSLTSRLAATASSSLSSEEAATARVRLLEIQEALS